MQRCRTWLIFHLFLFSTFAYSQTSGATAPEVTSFEPVDITDLVDLASGDFTYSVPVMALPGSPGGNYPFALSYKAGILHGQEASWVGLGWNLQAGSISRFVRSYPDDARGSLITTVTSYPSIYSYSVGLGYRGFSVGVNWDNHGGFGGSVGYGYQTGAYSGSASLRYDNQTGFNANTSIGSSYAGFGGTLGYDTASDFSASASTGIGPINVSIDSQGAVGVSNAMPGPTASVNSQKFGSLRTHSSQTSVNVGIFNFGWGRTKSYRIDENEAWGTIHLDQIGESDDVVERRRLDFANLTTGVVDETTDAQKQAFQARIDSYDLNQTYQRKARPTTIFPPTTGFKHVGIALDTHYQDFEQAYSTLPDNEDDRDSIAHNSVYSADYITRSFDGYNIAAQGLAGLAKPVNRQRGFTAFSDASSAVRVADGKWFFNPYRTLYRLMETGELQWDTDLQAFFQNSDWADDFDDNMVMLTDSGLIPDQPFYQADAFQNLPSDPKYKQFATRNRGTRLRYELDEEGKIARIVVRKADGVAYTFGVLQDENGITTAGAHPSNLSETKYTRQSKRADGSDEELSQKEFRNDSYAYAWHLAAVTAPDFVDRAPIGHYGPEDLGNYVTFHYSLTNPSYHWKTPYPKNDGPNGDTPYALVGRSAFDDQFQFERSEGIKEFYHLRLAKTRSHIAVFEQDFERLDNLSGMVNTATASEKTASGPNKARSWTESYIRRDQLVYFAGHHFRSAATMIQDENLRQAFYARFGNGLPTGVGHPEHYLVMFPLGTAEKLGLSQNQSYNVSMVPAGATGTSANLDAWSDTLTFLGNWNYGHHDVFRVNLDPQRPLPILDLNRHGVFNAMIVKATGAVSPHSFNGSVRLKAIALFRRDNDTNALVDSGSQSTITSIPSLAAFTETTLHNRHISRTQFDHDYHLAPGYQNVHNEGGTRDRGKLSLTAVHFQAAHSDLATSHPYTFSYYQNTQLHGLRDYYSKDPWGFPSSFSTEYAAAVDNRLLNNLDPNSAPIQAADSLKEITTPVGTKIKVDYERDRYSWVQDRAAVNRFLNLNRQDFGPILASFDRNADGSSPFKQANGDPVSVNEILSVLANYTWNKPAAGDFSVWPYQVMVVAEGESRDDCPFIDQFGNCAESGSGVNANANHHRFIVPVMQRGDNQLALPVVQTGVNPNVFQAGHPAAHELAAWIWHEIFQNPGDVVRFKIYGMPGTAYDPDQDGPLPAIVVPQETAYAENHLPQYGGEVFIGQYAGGLRVRSLTTEARQAGTGFGDAYVNTVEYDYTDPANGRDSGVIFADPEMYVNGVGGDRRIVRSEAYPYLNMPGAEVVYGSVTTQRVSSGRRSGFTRYTYHTARDPRVTMGTFSQSVREYPDSAPYKPSLGFRWSQANPNTQFLRFETRVQNDIPWKAAAHNDTLPVHFELDYQVRTRIVNNSGLIGLLQREERLDADHHLVGRTTRYYQAAYDPSQPGLPVRRFYRGAGGQLVEQDFITDQQPNSLNPLMPGSYVEKNAALLIGRRDGDGFRFSVKALLQDEIWNSFHNLKTVSEVYPQAGENKFYHRIEQQTAALDFSTGGEAIGSVKTLGADHVPIYEYHWKVPAHEIWDPQGAENGLKQQNLLTQPGFELWARTSRPFNAQAAGDWLNVLNDATTTIHGASLVAWRQNMIPENERAWAQTGTLHFQANETTVQNNDWYKIPTLPTSTRLNDAYTPSGGVWEVAAGGVWEVAAQTTAFNRFGAPIETRTRTGAYTSTYYEPTGQQVIATFANARQDQTYFEGFDYVSNDPNQVYPPLYKADLGYSLSRVPAHNGEPLSPAAFRDRLNYAYTGDTAARGVVTVDFVPNTVEDRIPGQSGNRLNYWLSFFVRKPGANQISVQHQSGTALIPLSPTRPSADHEGLWVTPAQGDWYFVKLKLAATDFGNLRLGDSGTLIDAVAIYPAEGDAKFPQATVSHFAYDPVFNQVNAMTDARGRTTRYQFNQKGELFRVYDTDGNLTSEHHRLEYQRLPQSSSSGSTPQ